VDEVGVAIVTYNSADVVGEALAALPEVLLARTVVVDNASGDDTLAVVRQWADRGLVVIAEQSNRGFGSAVNRALGLLDEAEYLLVLNPDAAVHLTDLMILVEYLKAHPSCGVVVPRLFRDGHPLQSARSLPVMRHLMWPVAPAPLARWLSDGGLPAEHATSGPVGAVEGACMLFRSKALRRVGGFDEGFFLYLEEADLARKLVRIGFSSDLCAEASAQHAVGRSRQHVPFAAAPHFVTSSLRYLRRWTPFQARLYILLARVCWHLRSRYGGLDPSLARAYRDALDDLRARP
jgi:GT2 family glycosyltransferase